MSSKPKFNPNQAYDIPDAPKSEKPAFDANAEFEEVKVEPKFTQLEAAGKKFEEGALMGARPALAGVGDAIGTAYGTFAGLSESGMGLGDRFKAALSEGGKAYDETRKATVKEQEEISKEFPKTAVAGNIAGNLLSLPLVAAKGLKGAAALGAGTGALSAASESDTIEDAASRVATGAALGAGAARVGQGLSGLLKGFKSGMASEGSELARKAGSMLKPIADAPGNFAAKAGSAATGVSEQEIKTFAKDPGKILKFFKDHGGDVQNMADNLREKWTANVKLARQAINRDIEKGLANRTDKVATDKILGALSKATEKLDSRYHADQLAEITRVFDDVASKGGQVDLKTLNTTVQYLQDLAKSSYSQGGKIFQRGDKVAAAAKDAAAVARRLLHDAAPDVGASYRKLAELHGIEKTLGRNLLKPGTSPNSVLQAGSKGAQGAKSLKRLSKFTGQDMVKDAQQAAAANTFGNASFSPADFTGKAVGRTLVGGGIGYAADGQEGALIGGALSSPAGLKLLIRGGRIPMEVLSKVPGFTGKLTDKFINQAAKILSVDAGRGGSMLAPLASQFAAGSPGQEVQRSLAELIKGDVRAPARK